MPPNPLTPPSQYSAEPPEDDVDNGFPTASSSHAHLGPEHLATPTSNVNMGLEMDGRSDTEGRGSPYISDNDDDDDDMDAYEGAPLTSTLSHDHQMNNELDALDLELMGPENAALLAAEHLGYDSNFTTSPPYYYQMSDQYVPYFPDETDENDETDETDETDEATEPYDPNSEEGYLQATTAPSSNLPTVMSEVSLQLAHLQQGQDHEEATEVADELHGVFVEHSIPSILIPILSTIESALAHSGPGHHVNYLSMAELSSVLVSSSTANPPHTTQLGTADVSLFGVENAASEANFPLFIATNPAWDVMTDADESEVEDNYNLSVGSFLQRWGENSSLHSAESKQPPRGPSLAALERHRDEQVPPVYISDLQGDRCDIQRFNWEELGVSRLEATQMRRQTYRNYTNLRFAQHWHPRINGSRLEDNQNFLRFRKMDFNHKINLSHFQLRNLIACPTRDHVFYAGKSRVLNWDPTSNATTARPSVAMNLTNPTVQPFNNASSGSVLISTLTVAHDILVAGGFSGEYAMVNLRGPKNAKHTEGIIIDHSNSITNHVQVHLARNSNLPQAVFVSNDTGVRVLDINTNKFISDQKYDYAMNCSAISPDKRLRVLVGDTRQVMICNAETGAILQRLDGHNDFGFACDWADDGWTVATGNQDMQIKIWDARKWTSSAGQSLPLATIAAEMAGVRKLKFSPLGSGKRILLAAEPADYISVIDAETFASKQTISFFGEIGGVDFTNDGQDIFVANCDDLRGGLMEFERCGFASYGIHALDDELVKNKLSSRRRVKYTTPGYDWIPDDEDLVEHPKARGTAELRARRGASLGVHMGYF